MPLHDGYCPRHPHMTEEQCKQYEKNADFLHYAALYAASLGCAQCVKAFLAEGGDPHRGTAGHEDWTLSAWAEYSFGKGHITRAQLDAVKSAVCAHTASGAPGGGLPK